MDHYTTDTNDKSYPTKDELTNDNEWADYAPGTSPEDFQPTDNYNSNKNDTAANYLKTNNDCDYDNVGPIENGLLAKPLPKEQDYIESTDSIVGVCGLRNLGNTCYMNAGLQVLLGIPSLLKYFLEQTPLPIANLGEDDSSGMINLITSSGGGESDHLLLYVDLFLLAAFTKLSHTVWTGRYLYYSPLHFKAFLGESFPPFRGYKAHDCQEFMGVLLDRINYALKSDSVVLGNNTIYGNEPFTTTEPLSKAPRLESDNNNIVITNNHSSRNSPSIIEETFTGHFSTRVTCCSCRHESMIEESFYFLSVPLPGAFEKQVRVLWSPINLSWFTNSSTNNGNNDVSVLECIVTVLKNQSVLDIKKALITLLDLNLKTEDMSLWEVKNGTPYRLLIDTVSIFLMRDESYTLYAIQTKITQTSSLGSTDNAISLVSNNNTATAINTSNTTNVYAVNNEDKTTIYGNSALRIDSYDNSAITSQMSAGRESERDATHSSQESPASLSAHDCVICLENLIDIELLVHPACGGVLCANCLEIMCSKTPEGELTSCPVCSEKITSQEFIPYPSLKNYRPETRRLTIPVIFQAKFQDSNTIAMRNFPHPFAMEVDNHITADQLYEWVKELPRHALFNNDDTTVFSLRLFDDTQDSRSIPNFSNEVVIIRPSDKLIVEYPVIYSFTTVCIAQHESIIDNNKEPLTLLNCIDAFSQSEILGPENLWFCPHCQENREVEKLIRIKELPTVLIVHLKRFAFHGTQGDKIDAPVKFPFNGVDFNSYVYTADGAHDIPEYELIGCVLHVGGLHGGHYTSFTRHPVTHKWWHYNDKQCKQVSPEYYNDIEREAYILVYLQDGALQELPERVNELSLTEDEIKLYEIIMKIMDKETQATVSTGVGCIYPQPYNMFIKDTYPIGNEGYSEDFYPDNPNNATVRDDNYNDNNNNSINYNSSGDVSSAGVMCTIESTVVEGSSVASACYATGHHYSYDTDNKKECQVDKEDIRIDCVDSSSNSKENLSQDTLHNSSSNVNS